jgi:hypothetical protein
MKSNFYKALYVVLFAFAALPSFAQFTAGVDVGLPVGNFSDVSSVGIGASGRYEAAIKEVDKLSWTASAGFTTFFEKKVSVPTGFVTDANGYPVFDPNTGLPKIKYTEEGGGSGTLIPITGGVKYYANERGSGFYGAADLGLVFGTNGFGTKFNFAPGVGYRYQKFDFAVRYNVISDANFFGLRAGYVLGK